MILQTKPEDDSTTAREPRKPIILHVVEKGTHTALCGAPVTPEDIQLACSVRKEGRKAHRCTTCSAAVYLHFIDMGASDKTAGEALEIWCRKKQVSEHRSLEGGNQ